MRRFAAVMAGLMAAGAFLLPASASAQSAPAAKVCHSTWGSLPKTAGPMVQDHIQRTRVGEATCWDRLAVDMGGIPVPGYNARYVAHCIADPSGMIKPMRGGAIIQVAVKAPAAAAFPANKANLNDVTGFRTFRQIRSAGSFEGITQICIGVRARLPFRVLKLHSSTTGKGILAVDVANHWG